MITIKQEQSDFIQIARGIAIFIVAYYHYSARVPYYALSATSPPLMAEHIGKLGVHIFFVISGFLIAKTLDHSQSLAGFYARRLSRLWPLYAFACVFVFLFINIFSVPTVPAGPQQFNATHPTPLDVLGNLLFLNDVSLSVDGAYWSIVVEVKFYFWLGIFAALFSRDFVKFFAWTSIAFSAVDFAIASFAPQAMQDAGMLYVVSRILHGVFLSQYLPFFALGTVLQRPERYQLIAPLALLAAFSAIATVAEDGAFVPLEDMRFLLVLSLFLTLDRLLLAGRVFIWIGDYSYALYLFHQMIGLTVVRMLTPYIGIDTAIVAALGIVALIAFAASQALEWRFRPQFTLWFEWLFRLIGLDRVRIDTSDRPPGQPPIEPTEATAPAGLNRV